MDALNAISARGVSRRKLFGLLGAAAGALVLSSRIEFAAAATGAGTYRTTAPLNLRSGPGTKHKVLLVIPQGATVVDYDGIMSHGFRGVDYKGTVGWVSDAYLVLVTTPAIIGTAKTTAAVYLRSGPGSGYPALALVPSGTWVEISASVQNGFRQSRYNGVWGWISDAHLGGSGTGAFTTTAQLNLRSGPGTGYSILLVMPAGATVVDYDGVIVNGFRGVDYQGTVGWCSNAYLV
jgi:uncharacterized protein YraI